MIVLLYFFLNKMKLNKLNKDKIKIKKVLLVKKINL
jgi:hypothetical protein